MKNSDVNKNVPASPVTGVPVEDARGGMLLGLTKREHFAAMAMQGLLANSGLLFSQKQHPDAVIFQHDIAGIAVMHADALLEELSK